MVCFPIWLFVSLTCSYVYTKLNKLLALRAQPEQHVQTEDWRMCMNSVIPVKLMFSVLKPWFRYYENRKYDAWLPLIVNSNNSLLWHADSESYDMLNQAVQ